MTDVDLAIRLTADASDATAAMDDMGSAAARMSDDVAAAGRASEDAASRMDGVADASDNVASKGAQAAGALSGLGELVGGPYGAAMQAGGIATQAMADAGDLLNVVTESAIVRKIKDTAVTIAQKTAQLATAAATRTAAAAQWAWNAAMSANPIGLIVAAVVALVAGFVLLYRNSSKFRAIVQAVMKASRVAIGKVLDILRKVGGFVAKVLVGYFRAYATVVRAVFRATVVVVRTAFNVVRSVVSSVIGRAVAIVQGARDKFRAAWQAVKTKAVEVWQGIRQGIADKVQAIRQLAADIQRKFGEVWTAIETKGAGVFRAILTPIQTAIDKVQSLIDWIAKIDLPDLGDLNPFGAGFAGTMTPPGGRPGTGRPDVSVVVQGPYGISDPLAIGAAVGDVVARRVRYLGG